MKIVVYFKDGTTQEYTCTFGKYFLSWVVTEEGALDILRHRLPAGTDTLIATIAPGLWQRVERWNDNKPDTPAG